MADDSAHRRLRTAGTVIDALGGTTKVARLVRRSVPQVSNMRAANKFPPGLYLVMTEALAEINASAPPTLWGQLARSRGSLESRQRSV